MEDQFIHESDQDVLAWVYENFIYQEPKTFSEIKCREKVVEVIGDFAAPIAIQLSLQGFSNTMDPPDISVKEKKLEGRIWKEKLNIKLKPKKDDELSYSRISRVFKNETRDFIKKFNIESQLSKKYLKDKSFKHIVFFGSEYLDLSVEEQKVLMDVYRLMDHELLERGKAATFVARFERINYVKHK
jgi:hypothetical protein